MMRDGDVASGYTMASPSLEAYNDNASSIADPIGDGRSQLKDAVHRSLRQEHDSFARSVLELAEQHFRRQDELISQCFKNGTSCEGTEGSVLMRGDSGSSKRAVRSRLNLLSPPLGTPAVTPTPGAGAWEPQLSLGTTLDRDPMNSFDQDLHVRAEEYKADKSFSALTMSPEMQETLAQSPPWQRRLLTCLYGVTGWWVTVEEPPRYGRLHAFVYGALFQTLCAIVILTDLGFAVHSVNHEVATIGQEKEPYFKYVENAFLAFYVIELSLKFIVHRWYFFCNEDYAWNLLDASFVSMGLVNQLLSELDADVGNVTFVRAVRVLKLSKALRVFRVMRFFTQLRLIVNSLLGSIMSLLWSLLTLALIFWVFALLLVQAVTTQITRDELDAFDTATRDELFEHFGSVQRTMLTLYISAFGGDDWLRYYNIASHSNFGAGLFLFFIAFTEIAVMNILTGVFVEQAMKLAQPERETLAEEKRKVELADEKELRHLCHQIASISSNQPASRRHSLIKRGDLQKGVNRKKFRALLSTLGPDTVRLVSFLRPARGRDGVYGNPTSSKQTDGSDDDEILIDDFISGCLRLKNGATRMDTQQLSIQSKVLQSHQVLVLETCEEIKGKVEDLLYRELKDLPQLAR